MLRNVYDFITGGSIAGPVGTAAAIACAALLPIGASSKGAVLVALVVATLACSTYEKIE